MSGTNPVGTWALTIWTGGSAQTPSTYKSNIDADFSVLQRVGDCFAPKPNSPAGMSVVLDAGFLVSTSPTNVQVVTEVAAQTLTITTAPTTPLQRIDLVCINSSTGVGSVIAGNPASSPTAPAITAGLLQIAQVHVGSGVSSIGNSDITDLRAVWGGGGSSGSSLQWGITTNSGDHFVVNYNPAVTALTDGLLLTFRANAANSTTTPDINVNSLGAITITKNGGNPLLPNDIAGNLAEYVIRYNSTFAHFELLNPAVQSGFTTGDVKTTLKTTADTGWIMMDDGTIGDAASGATTRAATDTQALFTLLWNNTSNTNCPVSGGRGASAALDFAAHKTISLPRVLGRALAGSGTGSGLTARTLGQVVGEENHTLSSGEQASMPVSTTNTGSGNANIDVWADPTSSGTGGNGVKFEFKTLFVDTVTVPVSITGTGTGTATGGGGAHNNMQPTVFFNYMIKL